jgi:dihydroceramide fatty acyl 2-hydroxylase
VTLDELFTNRANYWIGLALDLCVSIAVIAVGRARCASLVSFPAGIAAGAVAFTLYEYALHRWLYHGRRNRVAVLHRWHHREPDLLVGAPVFFSLGVTALNWLPAAWLVDAAFASVFAGTILFCYAQQSVIHHAAHNWPYSRGLAARSELRRHHLRHHHAGAGNFGISTVFWDCVFATRLPARPRSARSALTRSAARRAR